MKLIIAGTRSLNPSLDFIEGIRIHFGLRPSEIVCGGASGVDDQGKRWAIKHGTKFKMFPAQWDKYGKSAGPRRNREMAEYSDTLLLIWNGVSRGSSNMKSEMQLRDKLVYEVILKEPK